MPKAARTKQDAKPDDVTDHFEFVEGGRTFTCSKEAARSARDDGWWWFSVNDETRGQRYAPFRVTPGETRAEVQAKIVAWFDEMLVRRAAPPQNTHWARRGARPATAPTGVPAVPAVAEPESATG